MKKLLGILALVLVFTLVACSGEKANQSTENSDSDDTEKASNTEDMKIGLAVNTLNNPFFVDLKDGAEATAEEQGIELVVTDSQGDPGKQMSDVENLLQQGVDLLILNPVDSDAAGQAALLANDQGVPVITVDRQASEGDIVTHVGFNALKSGGIAAAYLEEALGGEGKVVEIQGILGTNVGQDRSSGFNDHMENVEGIEIIASQSANFDRGEALSVMEDILQANKEIDAVYAANDEMVMGALSAIESAGRLDEIVIIGTDAIDPAIEAIREGRLDATIAEPPFFLGREAVNAAIKTLNVEVVDDQITLENTLVTEDNVDEVKTR
ncbi:substrate-binding domain-containing protein [Pseudogracilibacillus auburnensis]|uniref:Ribose transport system substrate-binding protein n=1 Tax=Pseudogracilibacillus auburnensis TaxID=1494959 RepID=A0A2V3W9U0_9BACI|nr:substrate-binding domain-containing protein [Pseudogracilibacillus auburnensis]PXW85529.1 ribose transport system substrate-binding protein [Pseudogracilibacillus auburnensis]